MRENHYAILASNLKISYVFKYKISITLLLFLLCLGKRCLNPFAKIQNFIEIQSSTIELHPKSSTFSWLFC